MIATKTPARPVPGRYLTQADLRARYGITATELYRRRRSGQVPEPVRENVLGVSGRGARGKRLLWDPAEVEAWEIRREFTDLTARDALIRLGTGELVVSRLDVGRLLEMARAGQVIFALGGPLSASREKVFRRLMLGNPRRLPKAQALGLVADAARAPRPALPLSGTATNEQMVEAKVLRIIGGMAWAVGDHVMLEAGLGRRLVELEAVAIV